MKKLILLLALVFITNLQAQKRPKLVVGIIVDQMKMEYLYRFNDDFSPNGFKRLIDKGYTFHNMHYNYMPTYTAPGHASIYTGATPSTHGIISNDWFNRSLGKDMYCTDDDAVKTIGDGTEKEGKMSPKNLQATTITDELRMTTNFNAKVISMSVKDRGAILPGGHFANWSLWLSKTGSFVSSTFYGNALPDWVTQFNAEKRCMNYIDKGWSLLKPEADYNESLADKNDYEIKIDKNKDAIFPYDLKKIAADKGVEIIKTTPFGNTILADLAMKAIEKEDLGKDNVTDFLAISFSSPDYVGHTFGVHSMELQDTYLRLDLTIADFLTYLDKTVGKDNYLLFLTADHAAAENPSYLRDHKYDVKNINEKENTAALKKHSVDTFGIDLISDFSNSNLHFNKTLIKENGLDLNKIKQSFKDYLMTFKEVKRVYSEEEILASTGNDYFLNFIFKGYDPKQNGDIVVLYGTGHMEYGATGTTHGTPNSYDTHVPCIFYGWGIDTGVSHDKKSITQIAPTIAQKISIPFPNGTESNVLTEIFTKK